VRHILEEARQMRLASVFAVTTSAPAAEFFEKTGFAAVAHGDVPATKWQDYDPERRVRARAFRVEL
jgi:amino-acid N-acetyltransferase